jgi:hypothetical protein
MAIVKWTQDNWAVIVSVLFLISELLGESDKIKSNSVFGVIRDFLRGEAKKVEPEVLKATEKRDEKK